MVRFICHDYREWLGREMSLLSETPLDSYCTADTYMALENNTMNDDPCLFHRVLTDSRVFHPPWLKDRHLRK